MLAALDADLSAVQLDEGVAQRQSEPGATSELSGVRSSWDMRARKSDFARLARVTSSVRAATSISRRAV